MKQALGCDLSVRCTSTSTYCSRASIDQYADGKAWGQIVKEHQGVGIVTIVERTK